jgi:hypothetical protein
MSKFPQDPIAVYSLEHVLEEHGLKHIRVRRHGDLLILESGPKNRPMRHLRLRRDTRQWYTLDIATHTGDWQRVPTIRGRAREVLETVIRQFPWVLMPLP